MKSFNLNEIFQTQEDKDQAMTQLKSLANHPGWIFLKERILNVEINIYGENILELSSRIGKMTNVEMEELNGMAKKRAHLIILSALPEKLDQALKDKKENIYEQFDPYYKSPEEMKKAQKKNLE